MNFWQANPSQREVRQERCVGLHLRRHHVSADIIDVSLGNVAQRQELSAVLYRDRCKV